VKEFEDKELAQRVDSLAKTLVGFSKSHEVLESKSYTEDLNTFRNDVDRLIEGK